MQMLYNKLERKALLKEKELELKKLELELQVRKLDQEEAAQKLEQEEKKRRLDLEADHVGAFKETSVASSFNAELMNSSMFITKLY